LLYQNLRQVIQPPRLCFNWESKVNLSGVRAFQKDVITAPQDKFMMRGKFHSERFQFYDIVLS